MTENKRFICEVVDNDLFRIEKIIDNDESNVFSDCETVTELLNEFCEENDKLKKENEQLKEERDYFERKKCDYQKKISILTTNKIQLKQENEWLKQKLKKRQNEEIQELYEEIGFLTHFIEKQGFKVKRG